MSNMETLDAYVQAEDGALRWELQSTSTQKGVTISEIALTSQVWQGQTWTHRLQLFAPTAPHPAGRDAVLLYITTPPGRSETDFGVQAALAMGITCAFLHDVPNQPLFEGLFEDALIAHTFARYLDTGNATWPLLFPMTKSVTRAMDALQEFSRQAQSVSPNLSQNATVPIPFQRFLITGSSKRGWTSWLTAVVEAETGRVAGIAPMVYDNLHLLAQMPHQVETLGGYSASIHDYTELNLQQRMATPKGARLAQMVDPYTYRDRLALPKLLINGANDPYWMTDALNLYWPALPDPKHVLYVPNTGHFLNDPERIYSTLIAFVRATISGDTLPAPLLDIVETDTKLHLNANSPTEDVRAWAAHSPTRDFRASRWEPHALSPRNQAQSLTATIPKPSDGFMAVFGEFGFVYDGLPHTLSTPMHLSAVGS